MDPKTKPKNKKSKHSNKTNKKVDFLMTLHTIKKIKITNE